MEGSQQKATSMQIYIVRHSNFLLAMYKIGLKRYCLFERTG